MATGGAIKAGEAFIELTLKGARGFGSKLQGALRSMGRLAVTAAKVGVALTAAFGAAVLAGVTKSIKLFVQLGDQMQKMALRTGVSTEALSQLKFAAEQTGSGIETVERGFRGMARAVRGLERGLSTQVEAFQTLGIALSDIQGLEPDKQFELIAERLSEIEDPTRRAAVAMEIFGRSGTELLPLFQGGAAGIRNLRAQADILNATVSQEQADKAAALADRWNELKTVIRGTAIQVGSALAPALEMGLSAMRNFLLDWEIWLARLQLAFENAMVGIGERIQDTLNTFGLGLVGTPLYDPNLGSNFLGGSLGRSRQRQSAAGQRLQELEARERPSVAFENLLSAQADTIAEAVEDAVNTESTVAASGRTIGGFGADARVFGIQSIGRKQLRTLERIAKSQEETQQRLEQTGFFAFL